MRTRVRPDTPHRRSKDDKKPHGVLGAFAAALLATGSLGGFCLASMVLPASWAHAEPTPARSPGFREAAPPPPSPADPRPADGAPWSTVDRGQYRAYNQRASLQQRGKKVYAKYCVGCHGQNGDGLGPAATRLITKPRDFTKGIYKFRSTDSGSLPMEADLHRVISGGLSRVSMPAFPLMPEQEKVAVIEYIKSFYGDWEKHKGQRKIVSVPAPPDDLDQPERIRRGRVVYLAMQCGKCHGSDGAGTGATQTHYTDAWGNPQKPLNFTRGFLKGGNDPQDIYRTFHTGLRSVMPAYGGVTLAAVNIESLHTQKAYLRDGELETLQPCFESFPKTAGEVFTQMDDSQQRLLAQRNSWDLVAYVLSLRQLFPTDQAVLGKSQPTPSDGATP